jgi:fructose-1-phosphate kinase PfkB-like protein
MLRTCTSIIETSAAGGCRVTELIEPSPTVEEPCIQEITQREGLLPTAQALVIAGSMAPGFPADYQAKLAALARAAGVPVFLDLQGAPLRAAIAEQPALVKINLSEFVATFLSRPFPGWRTQRRAGAAGACRRNPRSRRRRVAPIRDDLRPDARRQQHPDRAGRGRARRSGDALSPTEVFNPIGSGDAFLAGMVARLVAAAPASDRHFTMAALADACVFATACAQSNARTARPGFLEDSFALDYRA